MHTDTPTATTTPPRRARRPLVVVAVLLVAVAVGAYWLADRAALADRRAEVADRGAEVMPFSLDATTHMFDARPDGGVQTVTADVSGDAEQIRLIRDHLRDEAERFQRGDFSDPAAIHGAQMPGLDVLRDHEGALQVTYEDVADGARITYDTTDPELVTALHHWFDAQLRDHGDHATMD